MVLTTIISHVILLEEREAVTDMKEVYFKEIFLFQLFYFLKYTKYFSASSIHSFTALLS